MRNLLFCILLSIFSCLDTYAVRAYPFPITYKQADGTTVTVRLHGDADFHYMTTLDGVLVVNVDNNIYVAKITDNGEMVATDILAHNAEERTAEELSLAAEQDKEEYIRRGHEQQDMLRAKPIMPQYKPSAFPHKGTPRVLVMLVDFTDTKFSVGSPIENFDQYLNKVGHGKGVFQDFYNESGRTYMESRNYGSVGDYFYCSSNGQFHPQFDIVEDIIHLPYNEAHYGKSEEMRLLIPDACNIAKSQYNVDFSKYDSDNDGYCDLVFIIYAGPGENTGGPESTIWPKSGWLPLDTTYDGKKVSRYGVSCELIDGGNDYIVEFGPGVFCHEFSHAMGMPDFYNTISDAAINNLGMEYWSLMDWGMYITDGSGRLPAPYTAWERYYMDWMDIPTISENGHYTLYPQNDENYNAYMIVNPENDNEYLVLESTQKREWASGLFGHGLQVTHVNFESQYFAITNNRVNTIAKYPRMTMIPADGTLTSTYGENLTISDLKAAAAKDLFSEANGATMLSRDSNLPNFDWFTDATHRSYTSDSRTYPNLSKIYNIKENADGSIEFDVILDTTTGVADITADKAVNMRKIYNLSGQEVGDNFRGIVIKGGKKYIK